MTNKKQFYHSCTIRFAADRPFNESEVQVRLQEKFARRPVDPDSITIEDWVEPEVNSPFWEP